MPTCDLGDDGAQRRGGEAVAEQQVVGGRGRHRVVAQSRCVHADAVPVVGDDKRLVQRDPARHPVAERLADDRGVVGQTERGIPGGPATPILQRLRQIPVEERGRRGDPALRERVDQRLVVVKPGLVDLAPPSGSTRDQEIENR